MSAACSNGRSRRAACRESAPGRQTYSAKAPCRRYSPHETPRTMRLSQRLISAGLAVIAASAETVESKVTRSPARKAFTAVARPARPRPTASCPITSGGMRRPVDPSIAVDVASANPAGAHAHQHVVLGDRRRVHFGDRQCAVFREQQRLHRKRAACCQTRQPGQDAEEDDRPDERPQSNDRTRIGAGKTCRDSAGSAGSRIQEHHRPADARRDHQQHHRLVQAGEHDRAAERHQAPHQPEIEAALGDGRRRGSRST